MNEMDEPVFQPPTPIDIARRALIQSGVVCRAALENCADEAYRQETVGRLSEWFDELDLWPHLEPCEESIIRCPFGELPRGLEIRGTWFIEGVAILAWALRRGDFPPHDKKVDPIAVTDALDFLNPDAAELLKAPALRDLAELKAAREWFYDVHCSLRGFLHHGGDGCLASWIGDFLKILAIDPNAVMVEGCLAVDGRSIVSADRERLIEWENAICERHRAAIWLAGEYPVYTELPVDT